jgi:hypothetical protein
VRPIGVSFTGAQPIGASPNLTKVQPKGKDLVILGLVLFTGMPANRVESYVLERRSIVCIGHSCQPIGLSLTCWREGVDCTGMQPMEACLLLWAWSSRAASRG